MTQETTRKEPTFGAPTEPSPTSPISFSMHSKQSPGHTFTPVMKRPTEMAQHLSTMEEKNMLNNQPKNDVVEQPSQPQPAPRNFTFTPAEPESSIESSLEPTEATRQMDETTTETLQSSESNPSEPMERVIPAQTTAPEKKGHFMDKVPAPYRRLLLVLLLALALLLVFFLLKPKAPESMESLQQGTSMPIEFRPVDEAEAQRAEEEARVLQQQAQALIEQQNTENTEQAVATTKNNANESKTTDNEISHSSVATTSMTETMPVTQTKPASVVAETTKKPVNTPSVIHQAEKPAPTKVAKTEPKVEKVEKSKSTPVNNTATKKAEPKSEVVSHNVSASSSKTLTIQKGVSLFQHFRDNGLGDNLPELNKMTKVNNKTSELKPGQKITVRLDNQKRIIEMNIGSGKYLRQADGSYIYK